MLRPELSSKLVGGRTGCCLECERRWADTDGMPTGTRDRFTLRDKAATLVRLAQGASFREGSEFARKRGGYARRRRGGVLIASRDGRLARDWVSQYPQAYVAFRKIADRYLAADFTTVSPKQVKAWARLGRWLAANEYAIVRSLYEKHWPATSGAIERPLREMKNAIYDRRANLKNFARVEHLLILAQLEQTNVADERQWVAVLRANHLAHAGAPPPRRLVDNPALSTR